MVNHELYNHIVKLGRIYRAYPALRTGTYERIQITNQQLLFKKYLGDQVVYVALNLADYPYDFNFGTHLGALVDVLSAEQVTVENGNAHITLQPFTSMIIVADDIVNNTDIANKNEIAAEDHDTEIIPGAKYRHFKGGEYELIDVARHSETNEELVVYRSLADGKVWARPKTMFVDKAGDVRKFEKID